MYTSLIPLFSPLSLSLSLSLSQIAYDSSAVMLSNRERFINFFRTYPSDVNFAPAMISFLQFYGWKRIMFITLQEGFFMGVSVYVLATLLNPKSKLLPIITVRLNCVLRSTSWYTQSNVNIMHCTSYTSYYVYYDKCYLFMNRCTTACLEC